ncbi:extracellular catalytic domain type 2 short-chain-length polyhydroxyalkanoate depolymerase [Janthinobacterium agaricidamnosum]|uniref:Polyhydroxybutyrate depolymerase, putative domain protein n=1 Tax=Janthinobacterium agaricidamnosum NBRC 102515 = DSM 9628 TaxID=1349767 RepID=W0VDT9_9BURK|nr:poly(3-hydroxybutyrate) depolymerase [Janthinobacterium agaricidamnosum]CDG85840.1 polyhydroxybutyrate depolymerase, putative domain protein [Janthinobacterium agaricidamnosum NBRC 102515 = DSM 9628]
MHTLPLKTACFIVLGQIALASHAANPAALPAYQADISQTSVSGLSSGAFMAAQFAVAYSGTVIGAGIVAGGPFYCAGAPSIGYYTPYLINAMTTCMDPASKNLPPPVPSVLWSAAQNFERSGDIDPTSNIKQQKVYIFSGSKDETVITQVVNQTKAFYQLAGTPDSQIRYVTNVAAGHAILTDSSQDKACAVTKSPYINDCDFVQARDILQQIYAPLNPPATKLSGKIIAFNQSSFVRSTLSSMSHTAYAYIPQACNSQSCKVHVAFHGCQQGAETIGDHFYARTGYNQVADTNNIIVLYPQANPSPYVPYNPNGCWDFWGYTSANALMPNFYTKTSVQMAAVKAMLDRLAAPRGSKLAVANLPQ